MYEYRRTPWKRLPDSEAEYRIWQRKADDGSFDQRHEWRAPNEIYQMENWIRGPRSWCPSAEVVNMVDEKTVAVGNMIRYLKNLNDPKANALVDAYYKSL